MWFIWNFLVSDSSFNRDYIPKNVLRELKLQNNTEMANA